MIAAANAAGNAALTAAATVVASTVAPAAAGTPTIGAGAAGATAPRKLYDDILQGLG